MKLFVALCALFTVCHIRASALKEHNVDELDLELLEELEAQDAALEEQEVDDLDLEVEELEEGDINATALVDHLKARPSKHPFCVRTHRPGWGGKCLLPTKEELNGQSCDFIYETGDSDPFNCYNPEEVCCVDCHVEKQKENCRMGTAVDTRRECCPDEISYKVMDSGCHCCITCIPSHRWCTNKNGICLADTRAEKRRCRNELFGVWKPRRCEGKYCACCILPILPGK